MSTLVQHSHIYPLDKPNNGGTFFFLTTLQGMVDKHSKIFLGTTLSTVLKNINIPKQQEGKFRGLVS